MTTQTLAELTAQTAEDVRVLRAALAEDQGTMAGRASLIAAAHPDRIARLLDAVERERASRQAAQAELERTQEERNRARLQGERDARRVLKGEMEQLQRERDEAHKDVARLRELLKLANGEVYALTLAQDAMQPDAWAVVNAKGKLINTCEVRELLAAPEDCDREYHEDAPHRVESLFLRAAAPVAQPLTLTDEQLIACIRGAAAGSVPMGLLRDVGPYEVTEPTWFARSLANAILKAAGAAAAQPEPSLWRVGACTFDNLLDAREHMRTDMTSYPLEAFVRAATGATGG